MTYRVVFEPAPLAAPDRFGRAAWIAVLHGDGIEHERWEFRATEDELLGVLRRTLEECRKTVGDPLSVKIVRLDDGGSEVCV